MADGLPTLTAAVCPLCAMPQVLADGRWPWHYPALPAPGACLTSTLPADVTQRLLRPAADPAGEATTEPDDNEAQA